MSFCARSALIPLLSGLMLGGACTPTQPEPEKKAAPVPEVKKVEAPAKKVEPPPQPALPIDPGPNMKFDAPFDGVSVAKSRTANDIAIEDFVVGEGPEAVKGGEVEVHYTGYLTDGSVFDTSLKRPRPFSFELGAGRVIKGWDEGVAGMKVGGKRKLVIPAKMGYGERRAGKIPPNSTLVFTIELLSFTPPPPPPQPLTAYEGKPVATKKLEDGLVAVDYKLGDGAEAHTGDTVAVHYRGTLKDGTEFDSSLTRPRPLVFPLGQGRVIKGWDVGIAGMKVGGLRKLIIPAKLAYGERARGKIPANADLAPGHLRSEAGVDAAPQDLADPPVAAGAEPPSLPRTPIGPVGCVLRFRVIDAALREVEGASVGIWAADAHGALPAAARLVTARSVGMGQFEAELQPEFRDRIRELAAQATAPGFAHGWLGTLAPDGVHTITLQPCVRVRFRCLGEGGEPLPGVRVALCVTPGFRDESLDPGEPVGPPDVSEHCATSGVDGMATIDGLVPRLYLLDIRHPHALLVTKLPEVDGIRVERDAEHELQFREALVAACVVEGDPTLVFVDRPRSLRLPNLARCYPSGMIAGLRRQLRPGDEGGFRVQFGFGDGRQPGPLQVAAFVPGAGWVAQEIPFVRAREAKVLRIQKPDLVGAVGGVVTIRLSEPDGTPSLVDQVQLEVKELTNPPALPGRPMRLPTFRDVALGSAIVLPSGRYEVQAPMSAQGLGLSGETNFQVSDGSTLHVHLRAPRRMAAVRPTAWTPEGMPLRFFRLGLTDRASGVRYDPLFTIASSTVFVPAGEYTAETVAQGYEPMVFPIDVGAPPFVWAETIVLSRTVR